MANCWNTLQNIGHPLKCFPSLTMFNMLNILPQLMTALYSPLIYFSGHYLFAVFFSVNAHFL